MAGFHQSMGHSVGLFTTMRPSPELVRLSMIIGLSGPELSDLVDKELSENPALETDLSGPQDDFPLSVYGETSRAQTNGGGQATVAYRPSPLEELTAQATLAVDSRDVWIARHLIGSLGSRGLLDEPTTAIADRLGLSAGRVEEVLERVQEALPPGVGARDLRECLLLQLSALAEQGTKHSIVTSLIRDHFDLLCSETKEKLAREIDVPEEDVVEALEFIRNRLRPFPALDSALPTWAREPVEHVWPSVQIEHGVGDKFSVRVIEAERYSLCISPSYELCAGASFGDAAARAHIDQYRNRARSFLNRVAQRWRTIRVITECIVARQEQYLRNGVRFLQPLTRAEVAKEVGLHESTVSRATSNKYVLMPDGSVEPFRKFFQASLPALEALKELIVEESAAKSDAELASALAARGYDVARRTVSKYRELLGIPPSRRRSSELIHR